MWQYTIIKMHCNGYLSNMMISIRTPNKCIYQIYTDATEEQTAYGNCVFYYIISFYWFSPSFGFLYSFFKNVITVLLVYFVRCIFFTKSGHLLCIVNHNVNFVLSQALNRDNVDIIWRSGIIQCRVCKWVLISTGIFLAWHCIKPQ